MHPDFKKKLESFIAGCRRIRAEHYPDEPETEKLKWITTQGKRYVQIRRPSPHGDFRCFVEIETGEVLKSDLVKPAITKVKRGNIFDEHNGLQNITPRGVAHADKIKRTA